MRSSCLNSIFVHWFGCVIIAQKIINRTHERCLRLIYNDKKSPFENLLDKDMSVSTHNKNLWSLAIKMYKVHRGVSPEALNDFLPLRQTDQYNLGNRSQFIIPDVKTENCKSLKEIDSLKNFKGTLIQIWKSANIFVFI